MKIFKKKGIDFEELFKKPELPAAEDLSEFIDKLTEIYQSNFKLFKYDQDVNVDYKTRFQNVNKLNPIPYGIPTLEKFH